MPTAPPRHRPVRPLPDSRPASSRRGYDARWRRLRRMYLAGHPLCELCLAAGRLTPATVVDHKATIRRRPDLRLDEGNLQSLCKACHDRKTAAEDGGFGRQATGD